MDIQNAASTLEEKTLEQVEDQSKLTTTEEKKKKQKNPKRVEQGKKLAAWNKQNKERLSNPVQTSTQAEMPLMTDDDATT